MKALGKRKKAVILGASGFIGINLARALSARNFDVALFSRRQSQHFPLGCAVITGTLAAPPMELMTEMRGATVFHLIGTTRPTNSTALAAAELADNVGATVALLEASRSLGCRWVFASSGGTVYGQAQTQLVSESHPTRPISSYGVAKLTLEHYFDLYRTIYGTDHVVARISNAYGPFQSSATGQGLIAVLLDRISRDEPLEIWGDGENVRDFVFIDDAANALITLAEAGQPGETYNVGSGSGISVNELVQNISSFLGRPSKAVHAAARGVDVRRNILDISKIHRELGWRPVTSLNDGVALTWRWLRGEMQTIWEEGQPER
jgi:UDP-glucose 4-epimerase